MYYAILGEDTPQAGPLRQQHLQAHLAHIEQVLATGDALKLAGPLKDGHGEVIGSLLVVDLPSEADARRFMEADPYHAAGVWGNIRIEVFSPAAGSWVGGRNW
ncbi:MAG: YciI family protein [Gammaproteobacteria bacterium]|nr:YciI family protein [Gammaproteobacteria bacterium]